MILLPGKLGEEQHGHRFSPSDTLSLQSACCPRGAGARVRQEAAAGTPRELKEGWPTLLIAGHSSRLSPWLDPGTFPGPQIGPFPARAQRMAHVGTYIS